MWNSVSKALALTPITENMTMWLTEDVLIKAEKLADELGCFPSDLINHPNVLITYNEDRYIADIELVN